MANADRSRKLLIRTALVTSSTIATLVGAQNLALLDARQIEETLTPTMEAATQILNAGSTEEPEGIGQVTPDVTIHRAAPGVLILRRAGQTGPLQAASDQTTAIQPPAPVQLAAPAPVIVQGDAPPPVVIQQSSSSSRSSSRTRSSR